MYNNISDLYNEIFTFNSMNQENIHLLEFKYGAWSYRIKSYKY